MESIKKLNIKGLRNFIATVMKSVFITDREKMRLSDIATNRLNELLIKGIK